VNTTVQLCVEYCLQVRKYLDALTVYFWACMPVLVSLATFSAFLFLGHELDAATVRSKPPRLALA